MAALPCPSIQMALALDLKGLLPWKILHLHLLRLLRIQQDPRQLRAMKYKWFFA
jgi:hypothetical protein